MAIELKYAEITEKIIGCAMTVHRKMKAGYSELIYSRCLAIEFDKIKLAHKKELELPIYYDEA
ncbi:MAG TPA: GxxExxY protein, partial [Flavisolibacter sp.]|nr:GxxExxY protein [Flavisolibacter sp.]